MTIWRLQAGAVGQLNGVGADEARVLVVEIDVGQTGTPFATAFNNLVNARGKDAVTNLCPVHGIYVCVDAQVLDLAGLLRDGCRVDVHLGGDAANVQAGATEDAAVDEGDLLVVPFVPMRVLPDPEPMTMRSYCATPSMRSTFSMLMWSSRCWC